MKKTLAILIASTALTSAIGLPAWSAMNRNDSTLGQAISAVVDDAKEAVERVLISSNDDDHDDDEYDDCDEEEDDDDDDDDHDEECNDSASNPAPAGTVAPPQNGLFGGSTPPLVIVN